MNDSKSDKINVYYNIQSDKGKMTIISAITDNGFEFYAEVKGDSEYFKSRETLYNNWHKPECFSYARYPQRHTDIYNGSATDMTKYDHVNQIHMVANITIVTEVFEYWLDCIDKDRSNIRFITDIINVEIPIFIIYNLIKFNNNGIKSNHVNLHLPLALSLPVVNTAMKIQYTNGVVEGIENHGFYNVKMVKELYHRLIQQSRIKEDGTLLI